MDHESGHNHRPPDDAGELKLPALTYEAFDRQLLANLHPSFQTQQTEIRRRGNG